MSLPALLRNWQIAANQTIVTSGDAQTDQQALLRGIVNSLLAVPLGAPTVVGSSDRTTAALDGVNRWTANNKLVWDVPGSAHSWIVLRFAGSGDVLIDCAMQSSGDNPCIAAVLAFADGPGFTGGSITTRPHATDQVILQDEAGLEDVNGDPLISWLASGFALVDRYISTWVPTDGSGARVVVYSGAGIGVGGGAADAWWTFERAFNPVSGWDTPFVGGVIGAAPSYAALFKPTAPVWGRALNLPMQIGFSTEACAVGAIGQRMGVVNGISGNFPLTFVGLYSESVPVGGEGPVSLLGRHGRIADLFFGSTAVGDGSTYPGDTSRRFRQIGALVYPWDGSA